MADHLTRLAARALGQAPSVAPRLPSRFEPAQAGPSPDWDEPAPFWDRDEPSYGGPVEDALAEGEPAAGRRSRPGRALTGVLGLADGRRPGPAAGAASRPPPARAPREPAAATPVRPGQPAGPDHAAGAAAGQRLGTAVHTGRPAVPARSGRAGEPVRGAPVVPVTPAVPPPVPVPRPPSREPSVRISIGRIEVRAVPGPAATPPAAPAPATPPRPGAGRPSEPAELTLSAYLRGDRGRTGADQRRPR